MSETPQCFPVVVDLTNKATVDMANVWRQTVVNKLTRTLPADGNNNSGGGAVTEVPVDDPFDLPVLLLANKYDMVGFFINYVFKFKLVHYHLTCIFAWLAWF